MVRIASLALAVLAVAGSLAIRPADASAASCGGTVAARASVHATLCLLNAQRRHHHLRPLRLNSRLSSAARGHSRDMVQRHYFSHVAPPGTTFVTRIRRTGYLHSAHWWRVGENLAWGWGRKGASPRSIVRAWMRSPKHRANILNPAFREIGIGLVPAAPKGRRRVAATYTTEFGTKR